MNALVETRSGGPSIALEERMRRLEQEFETMKASLLQRDASITDGREDRLSLIVFSGSLDRLIAAFVLATGAASMGMNVDMFFTFWGTAALRRESVKLEKSLIEKMFGWMLPKGSKKLPLSQMNMGGAGPIMIRSIMKKKGVASVEEMIGLAAELGVELNICTMSMDLLGMREGEIIDYPGLSYCGVAKFLATAAPGKMTMFL